MAFTLEIKSKGLFGRVRELNLEELYQNCGLQGGTVNEFYILEPDRVDPNYVMIYNPKRFGRGIALDMKQIRSGIVRLTYNIPTTRTEIADYINVVKEIVRQFKKASMYSINDEAEYSLDLLEEVRNEMTAFSLKTLNELCSNQDPDRSPCIRLALFPWYIPKEKLELYRDCQTLYDFERTMHELQDRPVYYARPFFFKEGDKLLARYAYPDRCECIFPINPKKAVNAMKAVPDVTWINFYLSDEKKTLGGDYPYERFIAYMMEHGAVRNDAETVILPSIPKEEFEAIVAYLNAESEPPKEVSAIGPNGKKVTDTADENE